MKVNTIIKTGLFSLAMATAIISVGCQPEEFKSGNALTNDDIDASFTITPIDGSTNHFRLTGTSEATNNIWNTGSGFVKGNSEYDIFLPDADTYTISHTVMGNGGSKNTTTQTLQVTTPDPVAGNLILNSKFTDGGANWTVANISASGASWTFADGVATVMATGSNQKAIYQGVQVEAGKQYKVDMLVSGQGAQDTWFEVYVSSVQPRDGQDYNDSFGSGPKRFALNTWAGCATTPFNGLISAVGCGDHTGNPMTFTTSGTVYVVIKCGGGNTGAINVDNVEFRRIN
nr:hypothetical protein [uncultured Flavobacterium sp.]